MRLSRLTNWGEGGEEVVAIPSGKVNRLAAIIGHNSLLGFDTRWLVFMRTVGLRRNQIFTALEYLRTREFDRSTPEGRQGERYRRGLLTGLANLLSKGSAMIVLIISIPLTLPYLGQERFGTWMTLASLTTVFSFFDFGIGSALLNAIARKNGRDCHEKSIAFVATNGLVLLSAMSGLLFLALTALIIFINNNAYIFDYVNFERSDEVFYSLLLFSLLICINIPASATNKIYLGLQQGYVAYIFNTVANLISISILITAPMMKYDIPELIAATFGIQIATSLLLLARMYFSKLLQFNLVRTAHIWKISAHMFRTGSVFFALQFAAVIGWGADLLLISSLLGPAYVAVFVVAQRLFQFVSQPISLVLQPLWATYAEASVRGDRSYIRTTLIYSCAVTFGVTLMVSALLFAFHKFILELWVGNEIIVPTVMILGFAIWTVLESCGIALAMFLNGTAILKPQLFVTGLFCIITIPLKVYAILNFGLSSVIYATITAYILSVVVPYSTIFRHHIVEKIRK